MVLTFRSTRSEKFWIVGEDEFGRRRSVMAEKRAEDYNWRLTYQHPNYQQEGTYSSRHGLIDALGEMFAKHDAAFTQAREAGDRPQERMRRDYNRAVDDGGNSLAAPITPRIDRS
jgi:hypothetical protein